MTLGEVMQAVSAFNRVAKDLCFFINQFEELSSFSAGVERLITFYEAIHHNQGEQGILNLHEGDMQAQLGAASCPGSEPRLATRKITATFFSSGQTSRVLSIRSLDLHYTGRKADSFSRSVADTSRR